MYLSSEYAHLPAVFFAVLSCIGIYIIFFEDQVQRTLLNAVKELEKDAYTMKMLQRTGSKVTAKTYYLFVYGFGGVFILLGIIGALARRNLMVFFGAAIYGLLIIWFLKPRDFLVGKVRSPFKVFADALTKTNIEKCDREIYSSCIILKNLAIVQKERPLAADAIFEILQKNAKDLKVIYSEMLSLYRTGYREEAFRFFAGIIGTGNARNYAALLEKVDRINPSELLSQVQALLESMKEKRLTDGYKKAQRNGIITLVLSTLCIIGVLADFLVVVVFMDMVGNLGYLGF